MGGTKLTTMWRANNAKMADSREGEEESFSSVDPCYCCQCDDAVFAVLKLNGLGVKVSGGDDVGEGQKPLGKSDDFRAATELMVHDTGATPTMSPNPVFDCKERQQSVVEPRQAVPGNLKPKESLTRRSSTKRLLRLAWT